MHSFFALCLKSELDNFSKPPNQTAILLAKYAIYSPVGKNLTSSSITWENASTPDEAADLAQSSLLSAVCPRNNDAITARNDLFGPVNLLSQSLFSGHKLLINNGAVLTILALSQYGASILTLSNFWQDANDQPFDFW